MYKIFIIIVSIGFSCSQAFAEIYSWTDKKGVKHYSTVAPSEDAANVIQSDEIEYDAEEDEARAQEYEQWLNKKKQEQKISSLKMKKHTKTLTSDENQSNTQTDEAVNSEYKSQNKSIIIYMDRHKHLHKRSKNIKTVKNPTIRQKLKNESVKPEKTQKVHREVKIEKVKSTQTIPADSSEKKSISIPKKR